MKKLLNTLYITNELCYLSKVGENIVIKIDDKEVKRLPIHILEGIICFNYNGVSPGVIKLCNENNVQLALMDPFGKLCGRFIGVSKGNVLLRREQYRIADDERSLSVAKNMILAKLTNSRRVLLRLIRDHKEKVNDVYINEVCESIKMQMERISEITDKDSLRGVEGEVARKYFSCFEAMILQQKEDFYFTNRNKRPPTDNVNALLSYMYSILSYDMLSALEAVGLDSYVGVFHTDRPGRASLALDMIEELRAYMVDRFVLSLINKRQIFNKHFEKKENGAILLNKEGKNIIFTQWQERKQQEIMHPFIKENCPIGLIPHIQAQLLARYIRGDLETYPPFFM
jgi:CRISPR-associated protein Cas1